jgi:hypothetical protein
MSKKKTAVQDEGGRLLHNPGDFAIRFTGRSALMLPLSSTAVRETSSYLIPHFKNTQKLRKINFEGRFLFPEKNRPSISPRS